MNTPRTSLTLVQGDLTEQTVDAVVNAANSSLLGGGGVDGAIHRRGGPEILAECRALRDGHYGRGLSTGQAVATTAGRLPARWVIHTVGPVHSAGTDRGDLLVSCYRESLRVAGELGARTVAFPAISTGVYRWPLADGARTAVTTVRAALAESPDAFDEIRFVVFDDRAREVYEAALTESGG
ncbi:O-acetyl-ADP-ribose deacetylase [Streptomyces kronopolitis]|uniref:O-acetyl-ADP-ribose deacetylase n=1 Tax=Streptomyces kronopolitis TaxID=1612435 RepID=UPI00343E7D9E